MNSGAPTVTPRLRRDEYKWRMAYIRDILSHAEYDEKDWSRA